MGEQADRAGPDPLLVLRRVPHGPDLVVVVATGEIDLVTAPLLSRELAAASSPVVVLDLAEVTFLAAAGLTVLLSAKQRASAAGSRFGLVGATPAVRRVLEVTGIAELMPCHRTLEAVIRELVVTAPD
ncbi:MAG TPA: STAS domain-containing protein [Actinophytocola sp.]|nr:STAS domain-containing protein [Actinophytocola sp.]